MGYWISFEKQKYFTILQVINIGLGMKVLSKILPVLFILGSLLSAQENVNFQSLSLEELMKIKVYAGTKSFETMENIPANITVIDKKDIQTFGYKTLAELLENIIGMFTSNDYSEIGTNIGVRGFNSSSFNRNMIISVNGVPQIYGFLANSPIIFTPVPVEIINRIEIVYAPLSIFYGSGSIYGVINIITNPYFSKVTETSGRNAENFLAVALGSNNDKRIFTKYSGSKEDINFSVGVSYSKNSGIDVPYLSLVSNPSTITSSGLSLGATTRNTMGKENFYLVLSGKVNNFSLNCTIEKSRTGFNYLMPAFSDKGQFNSLSTTISLSYKQNISSDFDLELQAIYNAGSHDMVFAWLSEDFYGIQALSTNTIQFNANTIYKASDKLTIKSGLFYNTLLSAINKYDVPSLGVATLLNSYAELQDNMASSALYAQFNFELSNSISIVGGLRVEKIYPVTVFQRQGIGTPIYNINKTTFRHDNMELLPSMAIIYKPQNNQVFKLLYGQASNHPSFFQYTLSLYSPGVNQLSPEKINSLELDYSFLLSRDNSFNVGLFYNSLSGMIERHNELTTSNTYITYFANEGNFTSVGLSFAYKSRFLNKYSTELGFSFQKTKDKRELFKDIKVAFCPDFLAYFKLSYNERDFSLGFHANFVSAMESYWDETLPVITNGTPGARVGNSTDPFLILGLNMRIDDIFSSSCFINLKCSNILDSEIRYPVISGNTWADKGYIGLGRTFLFTLGYNL